MKKLPIILAAIGVLLSTAAALLDGDPATKADWAGLAQGIGAVLTVYGVAAQSKWAGALKLALELAAKYGDRVEQAPNRVGVVKAKADTEAEQKAAGVHKLTQEVRGKA